MASNLSFFTFNTKNSTNIVLLTLWFIIFNCLGRCNKRPSHIMLLNRSIVHAIRLHVSEALTQHVFRARVQLNRTLAHLLQPSQGLLNKPRPSAAQSDHISQTNRALGLRRARGWFKTPSVGTPLENNRIT